MEYFENKLRIRFNNNYLRLPSSINYDELGDTLAMYVNHPDRNMQENDSSFEAWSLAFKAVGYKSVKLDWDTSNKRNRNQLRHYDRFLYRVEKFKALYPWFENREVNTDHIFGENVEKYINYGTTKVSQSSKGEDSENHFEEQLYKSERFRKEHNIQNGHIERQLPVGIFTGNPPTKANSLFTGKASAIDLYGIDNDGVFKIFELKVAKNKKAGALSEVFFYWCIIKDVISGEIKPTGDGKMRASELTWETILNSKNVENYLISSGTLHPIIRALCDEKQLCDFPLRYIENYTCE
jgi:hypothetical protein